MAFATATHCRDLTDEQWDLIGRFFPEPVRRADGRGRPWRENRAVLNGILWILRTGAPWADLPDRYPSYQTCHRRFQQWVRVGVLRSILEILAQALHDQGYLDLQEAFIDGSFAPAKQGGACVGKTKRGKGSKIMAIADRQGLPVAVHVESATPHEVTLVHATLAERFVSQLPVRLIGDNAYESDRLDAELARRGVELIAPHRRTRTQRTQDGARCVATNGGGRSSASLPGSRTFGGSSCVMNDWPRTFSGCYTWPAASFCCGVCEMASSSWSLVPGP
jgi:transposase